MNFVMKYVVLVVIILGMYSGGDIYASQAKHKVNTQVNQNQQKNQAIKHENDISDSINKLSQGLPEANSNADFIIKQLEKDNALTQEQKNTIASINNKLSKIDTEDKKTNLSSTVHDKNNKSIVRFKKFLLTMFKISFVISIVGATTSVVMFSIRKLEEYKDLKARYKEGFEFIEKTNLQLQQAKDQGSMLDISPTLIEELQKKLNGMLVSLKHKNLIGFDLRAGEMKDDKYLPIYKAIGWDEEAARRWPEG